MPGGTPSVLFDRALVGQRRTRAATHFHKHAFILDAACADLVDRVGTVNRGFRRILDLGCHTGSLARTLSALPGIELIVASDLSHAMAAQYGGASVVADEERLPFPPDSFDLVVSALSLHWVNDLPGSLIQINRILRPDGLFLGALFGGETLTELRQAIGIAEADVEGGMSPRVSPFGDIRQLGALLQRAGFALPVADTDRLTVRYKSPLDLMQDLRGMGETNPLVERRKRPLRRKTLARAFEIYQEKFGLKDGRIPATFDISYITGWAPHDSQQKPLQPGSARVSLAEAIGGAKENEPR